MKTTEKIHMENIIYYKLCFLGCEIRNKYRPNGDLDVTVLMPWERRNDQYIRKVIDRYREFRARPRDPTVGKTVRVKIDTFLPGIESRFTKELKKTGRIL